MDAKMTLEDLGFTEVPEKFKTENNLSEDEIGRIITEHKERYIVKTINGEFDAEITGNMRFTAESREDFPAVGDWVVMTAFDNEFAIIHKILPRSSIIQRQAVGHAGEVQIIATNIDYALLVQAVDRDFNINRLERYLTICNSSKVEPIVVLTKIDLIDESQKNEIIESIKARIKDIPIIAISNESHAGFDEFNKIFEKGKTYCLLGSSGVGKSTLLNNLSGKELMKTDHISENTGKGRHITSHRELVILESGAIIIDNPGMREVGVANSAEGLEITFDKIYHLAKNCKYADCTHIHESGCAVLSAVESGEIDKSSYENYLKIEKENAYFESTAAERRKKEKLFGKIVKDYKKKYKKK